MIDFLTEIPASAHTFGGIMRWHHTHVHHVRGSGGGRGPPGGAWLYIYSFLHRSGFCTMLAHTNMPTHTQLCTNSVVENVDKSVDNF